jgi:hypothetical protein
VSAFHGFGRLAFLAQGHVWLLDGTSDRFLDLGRSEFNDARLLGWSASGRLLVFRTGANLTYYDSVSGATKLGGASDAPALSPTTDEIAIRTASGILVGDQWLVQTARVESMAWSVDGRQLVYTDADPQAVHKVGLDTKGVVTIRVATEAPVSVQGLWRDGTVLAREEPGCISCVADGQQPFAIRPDGRLAKLPVMPRSPDLHAWSPDHAFLLVTQGFDRILWKGKSLAVCDSTATCRTLPQPDSRFDYQGRWSSDGRRLAFLRAPLLTTPGFPPSLVRSWYSAHELWTSKPDGSAARHIDPAPGAVYADWAADSRHLLEIRGQQLWLLNSETGTSKWVAGPLDAGDLTYYGWYDWPGQVSWWR